MKSQFMPTAVRYKKAGAMIRTNKPRVSANYQLMPSDFGVSADTAGICIMLPLINPRMQGEIYNVRNASTGDISVCASGNDQIEDGNTIISSYTMPAGASEDFDIQTTDNRWNIR